MSTLVLALWITGCASEGPPGPSAAPAAASPGFGPLARSPRVVVEGAPGTLVDPSDAVFSQDWVHQVDLHLTPQAAQSLFSSPYTYVRADLTYDGTTLVNIGLRLKGKLGSFRDLNGKAGFKLDFGEMGETATLLGLQQLTLNNNVQDCSSLHTPIGYRVFELAGAPVPRVAYAWVTVNGEPYGLYNVVETPDENWLKRHYADGSGNLYDGKYVYYGGWSYTLLDFQTDLDPLFQLEEGTDVNHVDVDGITNAIWNNWSKPTYYAETGAVVDWTETHGYLAAEQMIGHVDGYSLNENNYRFYFDPTDTLADFIPWDLDNAFIDEWLWGKDWNYPLGHLTASCWADADCRADQSAATGDLIAAMSKVDWDDEIDRLDLLTSAYIEADPRKECDTWASSRDALRTWMTDHPAVVAAFWGL